MSVPNNREHHYRNLRDRYTNCTYVDGNLELTWLQDENLDLDFLKDIREVSILLQCFSLEYLYDDLILLICTNKTMSLTYFILIS